MEINPEVSKVLSTGFKGPMDEIISRNAMRYVTVTSLLIVWGAANEHTNDGVFRNADLSDIDDIVGIPSFGEAMESVGWAVWDHESMTVKLPNFDEYNTCGRLRDKENNAARQKRYRENRNAKRNVTNDVTSNGREEKRREDNKYPLPPTVDAPVDATLDAAFDAWWAVAPNRVGKRDAKKSFQRAAALIAGRPASEGPGGDDPHAFLIDRIKAFAESPKAKGEFCPHPATWLNQGRYDDDPATWLRAGTPVVTVPRRGPEMDPARARATYNPGG